MAFKEKMKNFTFKWTVILSIIIVILAFWVGIYKLINRTTPEERFLKCIEEKFIGSGLKGEEAQTQWEECRKQADFQSKKQDH